MGYSMEAQLSCSASQVNAEVDVDAISRAFDAVRRASDAAENYLKRLHVCKQKQCEIRRSSQLVVINTSIDTQTKAENTLEIM